ncbi:type II secretion system protein GspM [Lichenicola sp.]|uniref:type II secretion system protein GspM n=1 Tax=Lichenicola sp. TaxID=2804529 RepID=UPI003B001AF3
MSVSTRSPGNRSAGRPAGFAGSLPQGRAGQASALGIAAIVLLLLWEAVGSPLIGLYQDRDEAIKGQRQMAARMDMLAAELPALRQAAAGSAARSGPVALIEGSSDAVAAAALQEKVQQMASSLGASLSSTESLPASQAGAYRRVGVRISVSAPFEVMVRLIAAIEQASPSMLIDDLQLHGSRIMVQAASPLEGAMTVMAFRAGKADAPTGAGQSDEPQQ